MSKRIWHKGPPPHVGWWNASTNRLHNIWRWWDGRVWSCPAEQGEGEVMAWMAAIQYDLIQADIEWTDYYPKNARAPRINPDE